MKKKMRLKLFDRQEIFIKKVLSWQYKFALYGGSMGGGKTVSMIALCAILVKHYPGIRIVFIREDLQQLKKTTIPSFFKFFPSTLYNKNKGWNRSECLLTTYNGSQILFMGENLSQDPNLERFRGLEVNVSILEEASGLSKELFDICIMRTGRWSLKKMPPMPLILLTTNPCPTWVKYLFYIPFKNKTIKEPYLFVESLTKDNVHLDKEYVKSMEEELPEDMRKRMFEGNWDFTDDENQLIRAATLLACEKFVESEDELITMGVDVAGAGGGRDSSGEVKETIIVRDKTIFTIMKGKNIFKIIQINNTNTTEVTNKTLELMEQYGIEEDRVCIDGSGVGSGVIGELEERNIFVINFKGGESPLEDDSPFGYKNLKSQCYWKLRLAMEHSEIGNITNETLKSDLTSIWYSIAGEKQIKIESKEETKKRLKGKSPDYADSLSYAWWARIHDELEPEPSVFFIKT